MRCFIKFLKRVLGLCRDERGFTLPEVLVAAGIMGGLAVVMFQLTKTQTNAQIKAKIASDVASLKSEVTTYLTSPIHCNANFYGKAAGGPVTPSDIYWCSSGTCKAAVGSGSSTSKIAVVSPGSEFTSPAGSADVRARVVGLSYTITNPSYPSGTQNAITIVPVTATIQTKEPGATVAGSASTTLYKTLAITINVPVVMTNTGAAPNTVIGCPTSLNSTVP